MLDGRESDVLLLSRIAAGEIVWPRASDPQLGAGARELLAQLLTVDQERRLGARVRAHRVCARAVIDNRAAVDRVLRQAGEKFERTRRPSLIL